MPKEKVKFRRISKRPEKKAPLDAVEPVPDVATTEPTAGAPQETAGWTLTDIAREVQPTPRPEITVDISRFFPGRTEGERVLIWQRPDVTGLYMVPDDAGLLMKRNPKWKPQLAVDVAMMAVCHAGPSPSTLNGGEKAGTFYEMLANSGNDRLWYYLVERMGQEFPDLKEGKAPLADDLMEYALRCFTRHPDEAGDLSEEAKQHLAALVEQKQALTAV